MTQASPLLTPSETAKIFGTSPETLRRWVRDGKISAVKMPSGRLKFRREDVDAKIAASYMPESA